jgi:energy-coupling factor transporter ATP-binding protein EcfA2
MPSVVKQSNKKAAKVGSVWDRIVPASEQAETGHRVLLYGPSGSGKTTLACTFPKPLLMIRPERAEDGTRSVRTVKGVDVTPYLTSPNQLDEVVEQQQGTSHYKTIVLDGITKFQDLVLKKILDLSAVPEQLSWGVANQQIWGIVSNELKAHLRKFLQLTEDGVHVVIVGGERSLNTDTDNPAMLLAPTIMVALTPSSMGWLHEVMDYNLSTFIRRRTEKRTISIGGKKTEKEVAGDGCEFCLRTAPDPLYQVKWGAGRDRPAPGIMVDPTFDKLDRVIQGK